MAVLYSLIKKEGLHIVRDTRTMVITLLMPVILMLLFGFAISTEVNNIRVAVVTERHNELTRDIIMRICENGTFDFKGISTPGEMEPLLRTGKTDAIVVLRNDGGKISTQIIADASDTNTARAVTMYLQSIISGNMKGESSVTVRTLYNPQMKSAYNFVPGIMGMIFILICAIMTSVSIVREKETGTMSLLIVSPIKPATIIVGKLIPYFLLSCIILAAILTLSYTILGLPYSSAIFYVAAVSLLYIVLALSIGLLVSTLVDTQLTALIVSAVMFMLPVIMLSGMIFPIDNMPVILQWISSVIPARWYIAAMRKLMIQQLSLQGVITEISILAGMTAVCLSSAVIKFKSTYR